MKIGYFLSCEEWAPAELVTQAAQAKEAGFEDLWISDHSHLPERAPEMIVSGFGPKAIELAARIGDGYCTVGPDADSVEQFRAAARDGAVLQGGLKVC